MINAGAMTAHSLLVGARATAMQRVDRFVEFSRLAGRKLGIDERAIASEMSAAHRNLVLAYMLRTHGVLEGDVPSVVESYTRQCSKKRDRARRVGDGLRSGDWRHPAGHLGARDGAGGRPRGHVRDGSGRVYDAVGDWLVRVGTPAKNGIAGGMVGCSRTGSIGAFSPRLASLHRIRLDSRGVALLEPLRVLPDPGLGNEYFPELLSVPRERGQEDRTTARRPGLRAVALCRPRRPGRASGSSALRGLVCRRAR